MKKNIDDRYFSVYDGPISNTIPAGVLNLAGVLDRIINDEDLKLLTEMVKNDHSLKQWCPYVSVSGAFEKRKNNLILDYSGITGVEYDNVDITLKEKLAADPITPALVYVTVSGKGLRLFYVIDNAKIENHLRYFNSLIYYLDNKYKIKADRSVSDLSRASYLAADERCVYNPEASVDSEILLNILPPDVVNGTLKSCCSATPYASSATPVPNFGTSTTTLVERPSDRLNHLPEIHERAVSALLEYGWKQRGELWTRPGKDLREGCSAKFSIYQGIWIFYCFSSNPLVYPFQANKGNNDCQVLCLLQYQGDWRACISNLSRQYLS